jgi:hypothetical protein
MEVQIYNPRYIGSGDLPSEAGPGKSVRLYPKNKLKKQEG